VNSRYLCRFFVFIVSCILAVSAVPAAATAQDISVSPFKALPSEDYKVLESGQPLIRTLRSVKELCLTPFDDTANAMLKKAGDLKPNYITEFLLSVPVSKPAIAQDMLKNLFSTLTDVVGYMYIPYWSVRQQTTYDLFDKMEIISQTNKNQSQTIVALQHMEPFDDFRAEYHCTTKNTGLSFSSRNLDSIIYSYRNFSAVAPDNMRWELYVFLQDDKLYAYGIGAVKAFDFFGVFRDRLEPSFAGRVEAFFLHVAGKLHNR
jgi:hypothetical protein